MFVGSKTFPQENASGPTSVSQQCSSPAIRRQWADGLEILFVFTAFEGVLWTPRSLGHSLLIAVVVGAVAWFTLRRNSRVELGLVWSSAESATWIIAIGGLVALAIPAAAILSGHSVPANPYWPTLRTLWPYVIWAFAQQFLLQSFFYLRLESLLAPRWALVVSTLLFTVAHLPNLALTTMTFVGALFFTETFRRYRSIYPLGIVHALLGTAIAYSFPDSLMHHMRVGLSYWQF
jgi:membrane protease YdiL (CAAX protease family)